MSETPEPEGMDHTGPCGGDRLGNQEPCEADWLVVEVGDDQ